jgi:hypothetical protein
MPVATFMLTHLHTNNSHTSSSHSSPTTLAAAATTARAGAAAGTAAAAAVPAEGELTLASAVTTLNGLSSAQHSLYMDFVVNGPGKVTFGQSSGVPPKPPNLLQAAPTMTAYFQQVEERDEENEDVIFFEEIVLQEVSSGSFFKKFLQEVSIRRCFRKFQPEIVQFEQWCVLCCSRALRSVTAADCDSGCCCCRYCWCAALCSSVAVHTATSQQLLRPLATAVMRCSSCSTLLSAWAHAVGVLIVPLHVVQAVTFSR